MKAIVKRNLKGKCQLMLADQSGRLCSYRTPVCLWLTVTHKAYLLLLAPVPVKVMAIVTALDPPSLTESLRTEPEDWDGDLGMVALDEGVNQLLASEGASKIGLGVATTSNCTDSTSV